MKINPSSKSDDSQATAKNLEHSAVMAAQKAIDSHSANKQVSAATIKEKLNFGAELDSLISRAREDKDSNLEPDKEKLLKKIDLLNITLERALHRRSRVLEVVLKANEMLLRAHLIAAVAECDNQQSCEDLGGKWCPGGTDSDGNLRDACCIDPRYQDCP